MNIMDHAIVYATEKHSGANRKGTDIPYIVHPLEALSIAATMTSDVEVLAAAILHDTVEDTDATEADIREKFGSRVAALVCADSEDKREDRPAYETWELRKQETLDYTQQASHDEQIIILADKLSNLRALYRDQLMIGQTLWERFNQKDKSKHAWYYCGIRDRLTHLADTVAYQEYKALTEKVFGC